MFSSTIKDKNNRKFIILTAIYIYSYKSSDFFLSLCFIGNLTISMFHKEFKILTAIYIYIYKSADFFFFFHSELDIPKSIYIYIYKSSVFFYFLIPMIHRDSLKVIVPGPK